MATGLAVSAVIQLATASFLIFVGWSLSARFPTSARGRPAMAGFGAYWLCLGAAALLRTLIFVGAAAGYPASGPDVAAASTFSHALSLAGIAGFMFYLAWVFSGRAGVAWTTLAVYLIFGVGQLWLLLQGGLKLDATDYRVPFYATADNALLPHVLAYWLALVPFALGTVGLVILAWRTDRAATKYRASIVGGALLVWAFASAADYSLRVAGVLELAPQTVALLAALAVYVAYFPPRAVQERILA